MGELVSILAETGVEDRVKNKGRRTGGDRWSCISMYIVRKYFVLSPKTTDCGHLTVNHQVLAFLRTVHSLTALSRLLFLNFLSPPPAVSRQSKHILISPPLNKHCELCHICSNVQVIKNVVTCSRAEIHLPKISGFAAQQW